MNRKERRAAASQNRRIAAPSAPDRSAVVEALMNSALRCHQSGQVAEAERYYHKILAMNPDHISSLHNLGLIAHRSGRYQAAATLIARAIALNDRSPIVITAWNSFVALGRVEMLLLTTIRRCAGFEFAEAHNDLGNALRSREGR